MKTKLIRRSEIDCPPILQTLADFCACLKHHLLRYKVKILLFFLTCCIFIAVFLHINASLIARNLGPKLHFVIAFCCIYGSPSFCAHFQFLNRLISGLFMNNGPGFRYFLALSSGAWQQMAKIIKLIAFCCLRRGVVVSILGDEPGDLGSIPSGGVAF